MNITLGTGKAVHKAAGNRMTPACGDRFRAGVQYTETTAEATCMRCTKTQTAPVTHEAPAPVAGLSKGMSRTLVVLTRKGQLTVNADNRVSLLGLVRRGLAVQDGNVVRSA